MPSEERQGTRFVVLLRGMNVGAHARIPMAALRSALIADGLTDVETYLQSGNVIATFPGSDTGQALARVSSCVESEFGFVVPAIGLSVEELREIVQANPYAEESDPKKVHAFVLPEPASPPEVEAITARQVKARERGSPDRVSVLGRAAYLHTPDGFGRSDLARMLTSGKSAPLAEATARNWATMTALLERVSKVSD